MASRTCAERGLIRGWLLLDCIGVPFSPLPSATQIGQTSPRKFGAQGQLDQVTSLLTTPGSRLFPPNGMKIAEYLTARLAQWEYQRETDIRRCAAGPGSVPKTVRPPTWNLVIRRASSARRWVPSRSFSWSSGSNQVPQRHDRADECPCACANGKSSARSVFSVYAIHDARPRMPPSPRAVLHSDRPHL